MHRSSLRIVSAVLCATGLGAATGAATAQEAPPLMLGVPSTAPSTAAVQPRPVAKPVTIKTAAATPAGEARVKTATAEIPKVPKPAAKAAAVTKPAKAPKTANPGVPPEARRAALIAAMTGQATPPAHHHIVQDIKTTCPGNPDAIGLSKVIKVDTEGGFYVGQTYHTRMPLEPKEVILTFDDGPMAGRTDRVLAALDHECTKASFFIVGQMAKAYPETLRKTAAAGHTIAYHTMTHPLGMVKWPLEKAQENIRGGWQTVDQILYGTVGERPATPFFRYPGLFNSRAINAWFNGLGMGVFAIDAAGNDWLKGYITLADGPNVMNRALKELEDRQGGILLLHDIKDSSSSIVAPLLRELKARGFKIVHIVPKTPAPKLVSGPIAGVMPTVAETWVPVAERGIDGYDLTKQMAQQGAGHAGQPSTAPLPAYAPPPAGSATGTPAATVVPTAPAVPAAAVAPLPVTPGRSATVVTAPLTTPARPSLPPVPARAADPTATGSLPPPVVPAPTPKPAATEPGWFSSTAASFRGLATAVGLW
ncbi:polysaccharide deacetylase family protein [Siculibacillus lacustris]|nr:polysaccharide deacetylase family protein [Siculibacillus lacustris]